MQANTPGASDCSGLFLWLGMRVRSLFDPERGHSSGPCWMATSGCEAGDPIAGIFYLMPKNLWAE
tara:strand:+ start:460 stop:654 length:195 start_codon:yes stop_codon:yes gene_type:complete